jgi:hypothetical protein
MLGLGSLGLITTSIFYVPQVNLPGSMASLRCIVPLVRAWNPVLGKPGDLRISDTREQIGRASV